MRWNVMRLLRYSLPLRISWISFSRSFLLSWVTIEYIVVPAIDVEHYDFVIEGDGLINHG